MRARQSNNPYFKTYRLSGLFCPTFLQDSPNLCISSSNFGFKWSDSALFGLKMPSGIDHSVGFYPFRGFAHF